LFGKDTALDYYRNTAGKPDLLVTSFCIDSTTEVSACSKCVKAPVTTTPVVVTQKKNEGIELRDLSVAALEPIAASTAPTAAATATSPTAASNSPTTATTNSPTTSRWSSLYSFIPWNKTASAATASASAASTTASTTDAAASATLESATATATTREAIIQEACKQTTQHQQPQHKCNCAAWHAQLYHTFSDERATFVDVLLRSTAAPTYFPARDGCVDGGVIAQNPALLATTFALKYGHTESGRKIEPLQLADIVLLSLGSGSHPMNMNTYGQHADLGLAQWVPNLMSLFNDASLDAADINCRNLLGQQYLRVQIKMPRAVDLANYNEWNDLVSWAEKESLDALFAQLEALFPRVSDDLSMQLE
jgi:hypothetical protein